MKRRGITIIIAFLVIIQSATAYDLKYEKSKTVEKTFVCKDGVELNISNKIGGNTTIKTWAKNEIQIKATILIRTRKKDLLDDILDDHEVIFLQDMNSVTTRTDIIRKGKWARKNVGRGENSANFSKSVTYEIFAPTYTHINTENYYGYTDISDCSGNIICNSAYGDIRLSNTNSTSITTIASYGNINIKNCGENTENIEAGNKYGHLNFDGYYDNIKVVSIYGNVTLNNKKLDASVTKIVGEGGHITLNCDSKVIDIKNKYGNIDLKGNSENIMIESGYGGIYVANESISGKVNITNRYGNTKYIGGFTTMTLGNRYGNISAENTGESGNEAVISTIYSNIKYLGYAKIFNLKNHYGNIKVDNNTSSKIENITVSNTYGSVNLNNVENINILKCTGDTYKIRNSNSITIDNANYANFDIDGLKDNFIIKSQMKYGKVNIQRIDPNFKTIQIPNYYSRINLSFNQLNNYSIDISDEIDISTDKRGQVRKSGKLKIDEALKNPDLKIIETESMFKVSQEGSAGKIVLDSQYSDIRLEKEKEL